MANILCTPGVRERRVWDVRSGPRILNAVETLSRATLPPSERSRQRQAGSDGWGWHSLASMRAISTAKYMSHRIASDSYTGTINAPSGRMGWASRDLT